MLFELLRVFDSFQLISALCCVNDVIHVNTMLTMTIKQIRDAGVTTGRGGGVYYWLYSDSVL